MTEHVNHSWRRIEMIKKRGPAGALYYCEKCFYFARTDTVSGPCPPPEGSEKLLGQER